jgi:NAD dependent epimerase/dehydratase
MPGLPFDRVLVTGGGGFIGGHLATELARRGCKVRAMLRYTSRADRGTLDWFEDDAAREVETQFGDLRDVESVMKAAEGVDVVFHLGAQIAIPYSYVNPRDYVKTNVEGTLNVAQAVLTHGVGRMIHTSTSECYGSAQTVPITEDHPLVGQSPYSASKIGADVLVDSFHRSFGLPATTVRPFNTYGPHQSTRAVIPTIITQALVGDTLKLGSLDPRRDLTYVSDTVEGFIAAAATPGLEGVTFQLGTGHDVSIGDLVDMVGEVLGRELNVELDEQRVRPALSEVERLISSPGRARELTGWEPQVDLREGLSRTIDWLRVHAARVAREGYGV